MDNRKELINEVQLKLWEDCLKLPDDHYKDEFSNECLKRDKERIRETKARFGKHIQNFYMKTDGEYDKDSRGNKKVYSRAHAFVKYYSGPLMNDFLGRETILELEEAK